MLKNKKGITLVALVVTIVVLLILAGVSINLVLGDNGIIAKAKEAQRKSAEASQNDLISMNELAQQLEEQINGSTGSGSPRKLLSPIGIAPLNSISGTIDTKNTNKYFFNINKIPFFLHLYNGINFTIYI